MKFLILLAVVVNFASSTHKVKIDIYYESLCPDSIKFVSQQLKPIYKDFKQHLDVTFVPFGKSSSYIDPNTKKIEFECQHGPDECFGNAVQGCMLSRIADQDTRVDYVACQMQFGADRAHRKCVEAFGVSYDEIAQCARSEYGANLLQGFEGVTGQVLQHTNWVPSIIYNQQISELSHTGNAPPLKDIICSFISNSHTAC